MELLQNADQLTDEQQAQLQLILKERWNKELKTQKQKQYDNIYNILTENVAKAKTRLASLAQTSPNKTKNKRTDQETVARIFRQKQEYEALMRQHQQEQRTRAQKKEHQHKKVERQKQREVKLVAIRERKFQEELINQ